MKPGEFGIYQLISLPKPRSPLGSKPQRGEISTSAPEVSTSLSSSLSKSGAAAWSLPTPFGKDSRDEANSGLSFSFWVSDGGSFYAPALYAHAGVDLQTAVFAKAENAAQTWGLALEALQTGLFKDIFLKPSEACRPAVIRKMQLVAENVRCRVFVFSKFNLPHWFFRASYSIASLGEVFVKCHETFPLPSKPTIATQPSGSVPKPNAQSKRLRA
jgi:hypothetical protein